MTEVKQSPFFRFCNTSFLDQFQRTTFSSTKMSQPSLDQVFDVNLLGAE